MTDVEVLNKKMEEALSNGNISSLSFIGELGNDTWVNDMLNMYQLGFFGFSHNTSSDAFSVNGVNNTQIYQDMATIITSRLGANNTKAFHINDENWLIEKLTKYKEGDLSSINEIPDLIILPDDINFDDKLNDLIVAINDDVNLPTLPIRIRYVSTKIQDDDDILYIGDVVKQNGDTLSFDTKNEDFEKALTQLGYDMGHSKTTKIAAHYKKKCDNIDKYLDGIYGRSKLEDTILSIKDENGNLSEVNMNFDSLRSYVQSEIPLYDGDGNKFDLTVDEINKVENKTDIILNELLKLYKEKEPYTYNHIVGMLELVPVISSGLDVELTKGEMDELRRMVILHDVGKFAMPLEVLSSKGRLSDSEFMVMKEHVNLDNVIIMRNSFINDSLDKALMHHSYTDKKYKGLERDKLTGLLTTLDIYNAITAERSYKSAETPEYGLDQMQRNVERGEVKPEYLEALKKGLMNANMLTAEDNKAIVA